MLFSPNRVSFLTFSAHSALSTRLFPATAERTASLRSTLPDTPPPPPGWPFTTVYVSSSFYIGNRGVCVSTEQICPRNPIGQLCCFHMVMTSEMRFLYANGLKRAFSLIIDWRIALPSQHVRRGVSNRLRSMGVVEWLWKEWLLIDSKRGSDRQSSHLNSFPNTTYVR